MLLVGRLIWFKIIIGIVSEAIDANPLRSEVVVNQTAERGLPK